MIDQPALRILLIGAGRRIQNNFLPALRCLDATFIPVGIHATSATRMVPLSARWGVPAVPDLAQLDLSGVDVVAISTPTAANAAVLAKLLEHKHRLTILIDTPIAWNRREFRETWRMLKQFRRVLIAEDFMNFPPFTLARQIVNSGIIGKIKHIELNRTGYLYHGLALARSFAAFSKVRSTRKLQTDAGPTIRYNLKDGLTIDVIGPYERQGRLTIKGTSGSITYDSTEENSLSKSSDEYAIQTKRNSDGLIESYFVKSPNINMESFCPEFAEMAKFPFEDKSDLNLLRGCGLISVFRSIIIPDGLNEDYGVKNGLYDGMVARLADRGVFTIDPLVWLGADAVSLARTLSAVL